jgi:hypothetical protein
VGTGSRLGAPQGDNVPNLFQCQAESPRLRDEVQDAQHVRVVHAIAGWRASWLRHDASGLIETQRLAADPAPRGHLSNPECTFGHGLRIDLPP